MIALLFTMIVDENERTKLEIVYNLYRDIMVNLAYSIVENRNDAEDIVGETFVKLAVSVESIKDPYSDETMLYVLKAVKNNASTFMKRFHNPKTVSLGSFESLSDKDFIAKLTIRENYKEVVETIKNLDGVYRDVMYYHFVMGMKDDEVAELLDRNIHTVKTQLVRGKRILLKNLKKGWRE